MYDFQRTLNFHFDKLDNGDISLVNTMQDRYHDLEMIVIVDSNNLIIKDIDVRFNKTPTDGCPKIKTKLDSLIGISLSKGMTKKIIDVLSGSEGCSNLRNMLLSSLPIVLNIIYGAGKASEEELLNNTSDNLKGSCIGYS